MPLSPTEYRMLREYCARGWKIFPLRPQTKDPYGKAAFDGLGWPDVATDKFQTVLQWAAMPRFQGCNWAMDCGASGLVVVDHDIWKEDVCELPGPTPETLTHATTKGGRHYIYSTKIPVRSLSNINRQYGFDTRSNRGYIVLPPSSTPAGAYTVHHDAPIVPCPDWVYDEVDRHSAAERDRDRKRIIDEDGRIADLELDHPADVSRGKDYLLFAAPEAVSFQGGNDTTYVVAARLRDFGLSQDTCVKLMLEHYNPTKAIPPWTEAEIARFVRNAFSYARNEHGVDSVHDMFTVLTQEELPPHPWLNRILDASVIDYGTIEYPIPLMGSHYYPGFVTVTTSPPGTGKSLLTLLEAAAIVTGRELSAEPVFEAAPILYINEDPAHVSYGRIYAVLEENAIPRAAIRGLHVGSFDQGDFRLMRETKRGIENNQKAINNLDAALERLKPRIVFLDPLANLHFLNENSNEHMNALYDLLNRMARRHKCAMSIVAHTPKGKADNQIGSLDAVRGASSQVGSARIVRTVHGMTEKQAKEYGVPSGSRRRFLQLTTAKNNLAPMAETRWYERHSVHLRHLDTMDTGGNVQRVTAGVLKPVDLSPVQVEDRDAVLLRLVSEHVTPGSPASLHSLSQAIEDSGHFAEGQRTIRNWIKELFSNPVQVGSYSYRITRTKGRNGREAESVSCSEV